MEITIDVDQLREDLIDKFGTGSMEYDIALADVERVRQASDQEVVEIALANRVNLYDYEIKLRGR